MNYYCFSTMHQPDCGMGLFAWIEDGSLIRWSAVDRPGNLPEYHT